MMNQNTDPQALLQGVSPSFRSYLEEKKAAHQKHLAGNGLPDYAYAADLEYRKRLDAIPGLFSLMHSICVSHAARVKQMGNMNWLAVGPTQCPEIYQITCDCAKRLGISIPQVFIDNSEEVNAYTIAMDDVEPVIVLGNLLVKRMSLDEIRVVIGHECGHIHNMHGVYNYFMQILEIGGQIAASLFVPQLQQILTAGALMLLQMWSRAAEITADRAGLICCEHLEDAYRINTKFLYGAINADEKISTEINLNDLRKQLEDANKSGARLEEVLYSHPTSIKRIFAEMEFAQCELFYNWRPDLREPGQMLRNKEDTDLRCRRIIEVVRKERT